jgi:hypothetical protein
MGGRRLQVRELPPLGRDRRSHAEDQPLPFSDFGTHASIAGGGDLGTARTQAAHASNFPRDSVLTSTSARLRSLPLLDVLVMLDIRLENR